VKNEGLRGLYRGYVATLSSFGPFSALYFLIYEESKAFTARYKQSTIYSASDNFICATAAGAFASFLTNPLDLGKLRFQVQRRIDASASMTTSGIGLGGVEIKAERQYTGLLDVLRRVYAGEVKLNFVYLILFRFWRD
jgi:hypothetical protein